MTHIDDEELRAEIARLLWVFYDKRIAGLGKLDLHKVLSRKNPYLFAAVGSADASAIVAELLRARISSSDETIFGNEFFEPLAEWVAKRAHSGDSAIAVRTSTGAGVDVEIEFPDRLTVIAVKSGINVFNAQSRAKQKDQFEQARHRLFKTRKQFDAVVGYSYGRKNSKELAFRELAGQAFWSELTGDEDFYLRIVDAIAEPSQRHAALFEAEFDQAVNRLTKEMLDNFATEDGSLDWRRLAALSSARKAPPKAPRTTIADSAAELEP